MAKRQISILWVSAHYKSANGRGSPFWLATAAAPMAGSARQVIDLDVAAFNWPTRRTTGGVLPIA